MTIFASSEEHAANPPESWVVARVGRRWRLSTAGGVQIGSTYPTKKQAEAARVEGPYADLYRKEADWYAGRPVRGWKPYEPPGGELLVRVMRGGRPGTD